MTALSAFGLLLILLGWLTWEGGCEIKRGCRVLVARISTRRKR